MPQKNKPKLVPIKPGNLHPDVLYAGATPAQHYKLERLIDGQAYFYKVGKGGCGQIQMLDAPDFAAKVFKPVECMHCGGSVLASEAIIVANKVRGMCRSHANAFWIKQSPMKLKPQEDKVWVAHKGPKVITGRGKLRGKSAK